MKHSGLNCSHRVFRVLALGHEISVSPRRSPAEIREVVGHKVRVGYATLGVITKRFIDSEAVDVAMV